MQPEIRVGLKYIERNWDWSNTWWVTSVGPVEVRLKSGPHRRTVSLEVLARYYMEARCEAA